jgi:hypothetical protein
MDFLNNSLDDIIQKVIQSRVMGVSVGKAGLRERGVEAFSMT